MPAMDNLDCQFKQHFQKKHDPFSVCQMVCIIRQFSPGSIFFIQTTLMRTLSRASIRLSKNIYDVISAWPRPSCPAQAHNKVALLWEECLLWYLGATVPTIVEKRKKKINGHLINRAVYQLNVFPPWRFKPNRSYQSAQLEQLLRVLSLSRTKMNFDFQITAMTVKQR